MQRMRNSHCSIKSTKNSTRFLSFLGTISINTLRTAYTAPGESEILDLDDNLYLGGLPENKLGLVFPTEVWTALLNYGYVGCIRDLFIDGQSKDVRRLAEIQKAAGVKPSCSKEPPKQCLSNPCQNNGVCREGWNRYVCDCSGTGYLGRSCERGRSFVEPSKLAPGCTLPPTLAAELRLARYSERKRNVFGDHRNRKSSDFKPRHRILIIV